MPKRKTIIYSLSVFLLMVSVSSAQMTDRADIKAAKIDYLGLKPVNNPFFLIDISKIRWFNSYSVNFFSGGGSSGSVGLYTSTILYEISPAFSLGLKLGIAHDPRFLLDHQISPNAILLPGFNLNYHPSEHFQFSIGFDTYSGAEYYMYHPYADYNGGKTKK
ncbi:MAG: hypothetical protein NTV06_04630 [candidate division Zixibacteria bacterium]|nr:hypothetical protein [candidate division Zixibacteria bacterium]